MPTFPAPETHPAHPLHRVRDIARSRDFYANVLGGEVVPLQTLVALANGWT